MITVSDVMTGTVIKAISGFYYVSADETVFECKARGSFRLAKVSPIVGDMVEFRAEGENKGVIERILPRRNCLERPLVANIDKLIIVSSFATPAPDTYLIDRLSAIAVFNNIKPVIVFNKSDTGDFTEYYRIYKNAGFSVYVVSVFNPKELLPLKSEFKNCVCAMAGNTGVGKSSLLNALFPGFDLKTGEVSNALGRGRHTTRHTELLKNASGGFVIDTPGFSSIEQIERRYEFKQKLCDCFEDFLPFSGSCRFSDCTHISEMGCGVLAAVESGKIEKSRHNSYVMLFEELKGANNWEK